MVEWNTQLIKKGVYYEGREDDVEQVIDHQKKLQSHHMAPGGLQARQKDTENCCPNESVKKVC